MKVVGICGSPRKGNTEWMLKKFLQGIAEGGIETDLILLRNKNIKGCDGCLKCEAGGKEREGLCRIKDDMQPIYQQIKDAQGIIFATPVYWFNISAQMKIFIDRTYAINDGGNYAFTGKAVGVVLTYEDENIFVSGGINTLRSFQDICAYVKANLIGMVYGSADKAGDIQTNGKLLQKAYDLGRTIVNSK